MEIVHPEKKCGTVKRTKIHYKSEGRRNIKHILLRFKYCNLHLCDGFGLEPKKREKAGKRLMNNSYNHRLTETGTGTLFTVQCNRVKFSKISEENLEPPWNRQHTRKQVREAQSENRKLSDSKAVRAFPGSSKRGNRTIGDGMGVRVSSVQKTHTRRQEGESVSENCIKCTWFGFFCCYISD